MSNKEPREWFVSEILIFALFHIVLNRIGLEGSRFIIHAIGHEHQFSETMEAIKYGRTNYFVWGCFVNSRGNRSKTLSNKIVHKDRDLRLFLVYTT